MTPTQLAIGLGALGWLVLGAVVIDQRGELSELRALVGETHSSDNSDDSASAPDSPELAARERAGLLSRVRRLEAELVALRPGVRAPRPMPPGEGFGGDSEADNSEAAVAAVVEALESYDPEVRDRLKAVVQEEQDRLRNERWEARRERMRERLGERVTGLATEANLSASQQETLSEWLATEQEQVVELFRQARQDFSFREARTKAGEIRDATDAQAKDLLDEEQYQAYQTMRDEEGPGRWGRGRRGRSSETRRE